MGIGDYCGECAETVLYFDEARSAVDYDGDAKNTIWRLKYGAAKYLARPVSQYLLDVVLATDWDFDCFTFVPIDAKRKRARGYNQAELLARELAELTTTPCFELLQKPKATPNQARLDREERMKNLKGAFNCVTRPPEHVVIVDDVMTTGSTLNECAKTLKSAGAKVIYGLTFASVPERAKTDKQVMNIRDFRPN